MKLCNTAPLATVVRRGLDILGVLAILAAFLFVWAVCCSAAFSAPPLIIHDDGYRVIERDASGIPQTVEITTIIDMRTGGDPDDPDQPDPDDPDPDEPDNPPEYDETLASDVEKWASEVNDPTTALSIIYAYEQIREALKAGKLTTDNVWLALSNATDDAIAAVDDARDWKGFRKKLSAELNLRLENNEFVSAAHIQRALMSVQAGLGKTTPEGASIGFDVLVPLGIKINEAIR